MYKQLFTRNTGVSQFLDDPVQRCPDREAIVFGETRITYRQLGDLVNQCAHFLRKEGLKQGDKIAVITRNCPEFIVADLAILKIGGISVKFNWRLSPEEMEYLLDLNEARFAFLRPERPEWGEELLQHYEGKLQFFQLSGEDGSSSLFDALAAMPKDPVTVEVGEHDVAFHMHTSGTTGMPKCVAYGSGNYLREMESMASCLEFRDGMVYQFVSQLFHSAGIGAYLVLAHGGTLVLMNKFDVRQYVESLEREKVTAIGVIPVVLSGILDEAEKRPYDLSHLQVVNYSTCPISPDLLDRAIQKLHCRFYQSYGMTEMSSVVTVLTAEDHLIDGGSHLRSVGRPIPGAAVRVVREDGTDCAVGETGEILAQGYGEMLEYCGMPEQTAAALAGGWYHTKDLGMLDEQGYLYIRGRKDAMIISGGENIYPEEVCNVILKCDKVAECAVYGIPDEKWGEVVKASVVLKPGETMTADELNKFCRKHSPSYRLPRQYEFLPELPKNTTGKVLIAELKKGRSNG